VARIVAIAPELMFASRIDSALVAAGHDVTVSRSLDAASTEGAELLVLDLDTQDPERGVATGLPVLGFFSHTAPRIRERSERAGVALAVPRSRLVRDMPELVSELLEKPA
jgi:hypothetical protein